MPNVPEKRGPKTGNTRLEMTQERKDLFLAALRESGGNFSAAAAVASPNSLAQAGLSQLQERYGSRPGICRCRG